MDELEKSAYVFMNQPRNDEERLEGILQCDIIQAIEDGFNGHVINRVVILKDVNWLIEIVLKQQKEINLLEGAVEQDDITKTRYATTMSELISLVL